MDRRALVEAEGRGPLRRITDMASGRRLVAAHWAPDGKQLVAKQFDDFESGGRIVDPTTGAVEPYVTDLMLSLPMPRPVIADT